MDGEDYLSDLPDELLRYILFFLPTLDSVRTSVLARRWRHLWTSVPVVDFSCLELKPSVIDGFFSSRGHHSVSHLHLSGLRIDDQYEFLVVGGIYGGKTYVLDSVEYAKFHELSMDRETLVYDLVEYAKSHDARHLTLLDLFFEQGGDVFYNLLFDWPSLLSMNLQIVGCANFLFSFSRIFAFRLSNLKTLSLDLGHNIFPNASLARLLSGCPVLEELRLYTAYFQPEVIQIAAPNLLRLSLMSSPEKLQIICPKLEYLMLNPFFYFAILQVEAPSLTRVRFYRIWRMGTFAHTLLDVPAVSITVSDKCLSDLTPRFLGKYKATIEGFPIFHKVLELKIKMYVAEKLSLDIVFDLLRRTPNLQSLVLTEAKKRASCDEVEVLVLDEWESPSWRRINEPHLLHLEHLERVSVNIKSERMRSAFLKTLSEACICSSVHGIE